jgi:hypothetical protein
MSVKYLKDHKGIKMYVGDTVVCMTSPTQYGSVFPQEGKIISMTDKSVRVEINDFEKVTRQAHRVAVMNKPEKNEFNINHDVRVKLTEYGIGKYIQHHSKYLRVSEISTPKVDEDGWSKFQLWYLMSIFGEYISMGSPLCFNSNIELIPDYYE